MRREKRNRQKVVHEPRGYRIESDYYPEESPHCFQVSVNVLEGRKLMWANPQAAVSYVVLILGKKKHRTGIRRNMEEPDYREYFIFEMSSSVLELQRSSLWVAIMEPRCCAPPRLLGEANIDLGAIWAQSRHQVFHKWAQLTLPDDPSAGAVGFIKLDISIVFKGEIQVIPPGVSEDVEEYNLLLPSGSEQQRANYVITIYGAFNLPGAAYSHGDRRYGKLLSTFVKASFCGLVAKTAVQHRSNSPVYCEQISFVEMFPTISEVIRLEVCSAEGCFNRVLAATQLRLSEISHDGENGFLPTFGPSLLHMYGNTCSTMLSNPGDDGPYHRGALLVSLKTIVPYYQQKVRTVNVEPISQVQPHSLWFLEDFCIFCPIFEVSMLDRRIAGKSCGVAITIGEIPSETKMDDEFVKSMNELKSRKLHYTGSLDVMRCRPVYGHLDFPNAFPCLQLAVRLPDFRFRMYRNNMVHGIIVHLEQVLSDVESRLKNIKYKSPNELTEELNKAWNDAIADIIKFLDIIQFSSTNTNSSDKIQRQYCTELDQKLLALQKEEIEKLHQQMTERIKSISSNSLSSNERSSSKCFNYNDGTKKTVRIMIAETRALAESLKKLLSKAAEGWPEIIIWLLNNGSRVAYSKISASDVIYSVILEQCGRNCGRIQTLFMKPVKCHKHMNTLASGCYCMAGKVEFSMWMGLFRQKSAFDNYLPTGFILKIKDYEMCIKTTAVMLLCRAFIYRAKLNVEDDKYLTMNPFVRMNVLNTVVETKIEQKTSSPIFNQVLRIHRMVFTTIDRLTSNPPIVVVEVFDSDLAGKTELIGRAQIEPVVDSTEDYEHAPKLQWHDLYRGTQLMGQILMSVQLLQIPEKVLKSTIYSPIEECYYAGDTKDYCIGSDEVETLPQNLIPKSTIYKIDVYWWGLRDIKTTRKPCVVLEIDGISIKSDVIVEKKMNCNFPNGRTSQILETPLGEDCSPPLSIKLYDSSTFGRTLFLASNVVKNPNKYVVNWLLKNEREASLKSASIASSDFCQVNQTVFVKKNNQSSKKSGELIGNVSIRDRFAQNNIKRTKWHKLFCRKEPVEEKYTLLPMFKKENESTKVDKKSPKFAPEKDWWFRFIYSQKEDIDDEDNNTKKIVIYDSELEYQPEFLKFKDWCTTLKLYNGKKTGIPKKDEQLYCGHLKAGLVLYKWPPPSSTIAVSSSGVELDKGYFDDYPRNDSAKFLIRVYIVKGINLTSKDVFGKYNPYIVIDCGKKHLGKRNNYIPKTQNPIFGKMYEFRCTLPEDYLLTVSVYDYDSAPADEIIGQTTIDLEDRIYTKHRARVGLSSEYVLSGYRKWRDCQKPSAILEELCFKNHIPQPVFPNVTTVIVNGVEYKDNEREKTYLSAAERKENICLNLLHNWHTLPICGYPLVPEHVETRSLFDPDKPGIDQGKLQLWVDIFPLNTGMFIPPPVDISPRKLEEYELRIIIWNVLYKLDDCIGHMKKANNLYVKAWIGSSEQAQQTDVHYKSMDGEGSFNWRMIFNFQYQHTERKLLIKDKGPFTEYEELIPPILVIQVMNSDILLGDDVLGTLTLNLSSMPKGTRLARDCTLDNIGTAKLIDLFSTRSIRAWWPLKSLNQITGSTSFTGKMDLEATLLSKEKAILMPVGVGREPPAPLPEPHRPEHCNSILKTFTGLKTIVFDRGYITVIIIFGAVLMIALVIACYFELYRMIVSPSTEPVDANSITKS